MKNILLPTLLASLILAYVHLAEAQQQAKIAKIGWLGAVPLPVKPPPGPK